MLLLTYKLTRASEWSERLLQNPFIFMSQKCDISVWPIATPSTIILYTVNIKVHFIYQISEVLFDTVCTSDRGIRNYNISNFTPLVIQWLEQVLRENNPSLIEIVISPSTVAYTFLAIMFALCYTFLYIQVWCCQEKSAGISAKIESQNTNFVCERASFEDLIALQLKKVNFCTMNANFKLYYLPKVGGWGEYICTGHPPPIEWGYIHTPFPLDHTLVPPPLPTASLYTTTWEVHNNVRSSSPDPPPPPPRPRFFFSYDIFVHGSKCQFIEGINLNLTHVCVCCDNICIYIHCIGCFCL